MRPLFASSLVWWPEILGVFVRNASRFSTCSEPEAEKAPGSAGACGALVLRAVCRLFQITC